jgi:alkaline phosphatase D
MVSCAKFNAGFFNAYDRIADRARRGDVDFLLHLGDYIYEASNTPPANQTPGADIGRPFAPLHECVTLDDYRTRYRQYGADPSVQRLRASLPIIATLDDHEFADGAWRGGADNHDEAAFGPWNDRKATAFRVREEWLPIRRPDPTDPSRVFRSVALGDLADLILTDSRSRRDLPVPAPAMYDPDRTAMGPEQRAWFLDTLTRSTATWRLWGNPSVLSPTFHPNLPEDLLPAMKKLKLVTPDGASYDHDQWDGYPAERDAILSHVEAGIDDLVVLSGDIHVGLACEVHRDPYTAGDAEPITAEIVTASVTSQNLDDKLGYPYGGSQAAQDRFVEAFPHARWTDFDGHGYVLIDVDQARLEAQWWFVDDVLALDDHEFCPAAFQVHRGSSRLHQVAAPTVRTRPRDVAPVATAD